MVHDLNCFSEVFDCFVNVRKHIFLIGSVNSTSTTIYTYSVAMWTWVDSLNVVTRWFPDVSLLYTPGLLNENIYKVLL